MTFFESPSELRLATWNCCGGLTKKWRALEDLGAHLMIVQECASETEAEAADRGWQACWSGNGPKGIAVIARQGLSLAKLEQTNGWALPVRVTGLVELDVLGVWALPPKIAGHSYGKQGLLSIPGLDALPGCAWVAGDFNSWNHPAHIEFLDQMSKRGFVSAYHAFHGIQRNEERDPTFFLYHHNDKPYHIDLHFVRDTWAIVDVTVGSYERYVASKLSDHVPVVVTVSR